MDDNILKFLSGVKTTFNKQNKSKGITLELNTVDKELPPTGIVVDNPMLEYILDRRFMAFGRCYLLYGDKGCSKTSLLFDIAKIFIKAGGYMIWVETENAPDFRYMELQGVDPTKVIYHNPKTLNEAIDLCKIIIQQYGKNSDGKTPILVALDSIAGGSTEYEQDQNAVGDCKPGEHAKLMAAFYRRIIPYLECENMVFVATNQLREKIGGMTGFGTEKPEELIGGRAQRFNSTYQWKVARIGDILLKDHMKVERKAGSLHKITVKRNKLGREGNSQWAEFDLYINGGIDWYSPLVRRLGKLYPSLVKENGGKRYSWMVPNCKTINADGVEEIISTEESYKDMELGQLICYSNDAKEACRAAFGIPDMPTPEIEKEIAKANTRKRKKSTELEKEIEERAASVTGEEDVED